MSDLSFDLRRDEAYVRNYAGRVIALLEAQNDECSITTTGPLTVEEANLLGRALIGWSVWRRGVTPSMDFYELERTTLSPGTPAPAGHDRKA